MRIKFRNLFKIISLKFVIFCVPVGGWFSNQPFNTRSSRFLSHYITTRIIYNKGLDCAKLFVISLSLIYQMNEGDTYLTILSFIISNPVAGRGLQPRPKRLMLLFLFTFQT